MNIWTTDNMGFLDYKAYFDENHTVIFVVSHRDYIPLISPNTGEAFDFRATRTVDKELGYRKVEKIGLGVKWYAPNGVFLLLIPRSSSHKKFNITLANNPGLIDSSYRNEIAALITPYNHTSPVRFKAGDRIVQGVLLNTAFINSPVIKDVYIVINREVFDDWENIMKSHRRGGFGSTG